MPPLVIRPTLTLLEFYERELARPERAITAHLPRLRDLARRCAYVVEFGVKRGASSSALLLGAAHVTSYDLVPTKQARELKRIVGERWDYRIEDTRTAMVPFCDLMFFDSLHTYEQMQIELERHAHRSLRYLVFHDVSTFGEVGADGESGRQAWTYVVGQSVPLQHLGIRPAIDQFQIAHPEWRIAERYVDSHGLLVLRKE